MGRIDDFVKKSIYKIINKVNGKVYIGQSVDPYRRFHEHIKGKKNELSLIHLAIKKYGIHNFEVSIIEKDIEDYNEKEVFWINYYNSTDRNFGYNIAYGGENPPVLSGEDSCLAKMSNQDFHKLENEIANSNISFIELAKKYGLSENYLTKINNGTARRNKKLKYPLRKQINLVKDETIIQKIRHELIYTSFSTEHIARRNKVDSLLVYYINYGIKYKIDNLDYPLRNNNSKISKWMLQHIIHDLKENKLRLVDIEKKYNISKSTVNRINNGKILKLENENYPIRPSSKRVYQPVSTISGETESSPVIDTQVGCK